jgi:hypothetical protein
VIVAVAFCPAPHGLVPVLNNGARSEFGGLRAAAPEALRRVGPGPSRLIPLGGADPSATYSPLAGQWTADA